MKTAKKFIAILLVCIMTCSAMSCLAFADADEISLLDVWAKMNKHRFAYSGYSVAAEGDTGNECFVFRGQDMPSEYLLPVNGITLSFDEDWQTYVYSNGMYIEVALDEDGVYYIDFYGLYVCDDNDEYYYYDGRYIDADRQRDGSNVYPWSVGATPSDEVYACLNDGWLYISGIGRMKDFNDPAERPWNDKAAEIVEVAVDTVSYIGKNTFAGLGSEECPIYSIVVGDGVETIGEAAFAGLKSDEGLYLYLPETLKAIGPRAFADMPMDIIIFQGGKCDIADDAFSDVTAAAAIVYGTDWPEEDKLDYGGDLSYETWYIFETEDEYGEESYGWSYRFVPKGEFEYFNETSEDFRLVSAELIAGTVPEGIDFTDPVIRFTMTDNVKVRFCYEYIGEDDPIDDPDDDSGDDSGSLLGCLFTGFLSGITGVSRTVSALINMILRVFNIFLSFEIRFF